MARVFTNGFELCDRGDQGGHDADMWFWDADETVRLSGNMYADSSIVRVNGRSLKILPGSGSCYIAHYFSSKTEFYFRMAYRHDVGVRDDTNSLVRFLIPTGDDVKIRINGSTYFLSIDQGGVQRDIQTVKTILQTTWHLLEFHFKADAANGRMELKCDGTTVCEYDGNTGTAGATGVKIGCLVDSFLFAYGTYWFDDIAMNDISGTRNNSWVGDGHVVALRPNGNGTYSELTGSDGNQVDNYQLMDENPLDEADYVEGLTTGLRDSYALQSSLSAGIPPGATIKHASATIVGKTLNVGGDAVEGFVRVSGSDYYATKQNLLGDWVGHKFDFDLNPATAAAWTTTELDGAEAGVRTAAV